jgi:tetraacyldisaccharide 4'-kinase
VAAIYGKIASARLRAPPRHRSPLPVICVGNFTAGGNGKTPLTQYLARRLIEAGGRPALLTRGYGGRLSEPCWVNADADLAADVGDEPLLLARIAPTLRARARDLAARRIEADPRAFTHILMDDGLQNPALAKSLRIAIVDVGKGVGNGRVIPAGPLRAPLAAQLRVTDLIVLNAGASEPAGSAALVAGFRERGYAGEVLTARVRTTGDASWLRGRRVVAVSAIAGPDRFSRLLAHHGAVVVAHEAFPDHHAFTTAEAARLLATADRLGACLVTTSKDHVRLGGEPGVLAELRKKSAVVDVELYFEPGEAARLAGHLLRVGPAA